MGEMLTAAGASVAAVGEGSSNAVLGGSVAEVAAAANPLSDAVLFNDESLRLPGEQSSEGDKDKELHCFATVGLLVLLHVVFCYHWNTRQKRESVQYTYRSLVIERRYYSVLLAFFSHVGVPFPQYSVDPDGDASNPGATSSRNFLFGLLRLLRDACRSLLRGSFSGLPLLAYVSHLMWEMRPLESFVGGPFPYGRLWLTLLVTAVAAELLMQKIVLDCLSRRRYVGPPNQNPALILMARGTSGLSALSAALLVVHAEWKFLGIRGGIRSEITAAASVASAQYRAAYANDQMMLLWRLFALTALSWNVHRSGPVMGAFSAVLYLNGITAFLSVPYWNNFLALFLCLSFCVSLKAEGGRAADFVPCVDHVSWDAQGRIRRAGSGHHHHGAAHRRTVDGDETAEGSDRDEEDSEGVEQVYSSDNEEDIARNRNRRDRSRDSGDVEVGLVSPTGTTSRRVGAMAVNGEGSAVPDSPMPTSESGARSAAGSAFSRIGTGVRRIGSSQISSGVGG